MLNQTQFNKQLSTLKANGEKLQQTIHEMGVYALHCVNVGKTTGIDSPMQKLWDTLAHLKGINQQAFMQWAQEYGSLRFVKNEQGKFIVKYLDRTKKEPDFDAVGNVVFAEAFPFWEFSKEPNPNLKPYDVANALRNILSQAKSAATGGAKGDKPIRVVEHKELLDVINYVINSPDSARQKLGLTSVSEDMIPLDTMTPDDEVQEEIAEARGMLKVA